MSNKELAKTDNTYQLPALSAELMNEIAEELNGLTLTLDKVKIPSGGTVSFEVPGDDPDSPDMVKEIVGVIVDHYPLNAYWVEKYNGQNVMPNCYSTDNRTGVGTPGGNCAKCAFNQFGSDEEGVGKACKNSHRLYILQSGELYPMFITVPPTSLKTLSDYLGKRVVTKGMKSYGVVTRVTLKKETNSTGIEYSQLQFSLVEKLAPEAVAVMKAFSDSIKTITRRVDLMDDAEPPVEADANVDRETGEIIEPL